MGAEELNIRILGASATWLREVHGEKALSKLAEASGIDLDWFGSGSFWISVAKVERYLEGLYEVCEKNDEVFLDACRYNLEDGYGPMHGLLRALSVSTTIRLVVRTMPLVSRVSRYEAEIAPGCATLTYRTTVPESRLLCMSRWATFDKWPSVASAAWMELSHPQCVAEGDDACVYVVRYPRESRRGSTLLSIALGIAVALGLSTVLTVPLPHLMVTVPALFVAMNYVRRAHQSKRLESRSLARVHSDLREQVHANAEANAEIVALQRRQQAWSEFIDSQVQDRTDTLEAVVERLRSLQEERAVTLRGVTHDLRNPLTVLKAAPYHLKESLVVARELPHIAEDIEEAVERMEGLLEDLMKIAMKEHRRGGRVPTRIEVSALGVRLERRLKALVLGRDIKVSVLTTREAPESVEVDLLVFDRVLDNLFTNAAKYTERGSILLEIGGHPGTLTFKLSDTGRGIAEDRIEEIFEPGGSRVTDRAPRSFGVGLSVVLRLVHEAGGKLEVMSRPGEGSTFWVHFPNHPPESSPVLVDEERMLADVITIRKA